MVNFAREVFVCICPTDVPRHDPEATGMAAQLRFRQGTPADLDRLDRADHKDDYLATLRERFDDHYWLLGEVDDRVVTYTWLHQKGGAEYRFLAGCGITMRDDCGYGYDAWTPPSLRGQGLRRVAFLEELNVLRERGCTWEASFFVKHQLDGATRSLGSVGIEVIPLWRVRVQRDKSFTAEKLHPELADVARPSFLEGQ